MILALNIISTLIAILFSSAVFIVLSETPTAKDEFGKNVTFAMLGCGVIIAGIWI